MTASTYYTDHIFQKMYLEELERVNLPKEWWSVLLPTLRESAGFSWFSK